MIKTTPDVTTKKAPENGALSIYRHSHILLLG
jgi:hypothetical protein